MLDLNAVQQGDGESGKRESSFDFANERKIFIIQLPFFECYFLFGAVLRHFLTVYCGLGWDGCVFVGVFGRVLVCLQFC